MAEQLRLMAVHAHPDDESSKGAATMARYVREGVDVLVVTCTGGERGSVLNAKMDRPEVWRDIAEIRRREMAAAREILGVRQAWLGFVDSGWIEGYKPGDLEGLPEDAFAREPLEVATAPLVRLVRQFRPHVMTTYDEDGGYPHPDHVMCHRVSVEAFEAAGDAGRYREFGEAWRPLKLYFHMSFSRGKLQALHDAMLAAGLESPYATWLEELDWEKLDKSSRITTRVECAEFFPYRNDALRAHATQVDPDGFWFSVPLDIEQKTWPTEEYELARSVVETMAPEDDLFAGVRPVR